MKTEFDNNLRVVRQKRNSCKNPYFSEDKSIVVNELKRISDGHLENVAKFDNVREDSTICIIVFPNQVKKILLSYLKNEMSDDALNIWAEFLCFRGEYVGNDDNEDEDYYEDMWYVVQKLSTPEIDGEITPDTVREYLRELDKYFTNNSESTNDAL